MLAELNHLHPTLSEDAAAPAAPIGPPDLARWQVDSLEGGAVHSRRLPRIGRRLRRRERFAISSGSVTPLIAEEPIVAVRTTR